MESTRKPCLLISLLLFVLLVSTVHGAQLADARDAAAGGDEERTTVRTGAAGHEGHGYSSHSGGHNPNGGMPEQGGAGVVDPRNLAVRSHHRHHGAASRRALGYSSAAICALVGAILAVVLV
ncbi:uncharacterized protein LOC133890092 isoform X2 [Phragmites australis]|uniref:uncharacterized protein LOC133890092 isoform X2 n=1 Tax=Phragmites australis TaxID=29695 RepID=UPI002D7660B2|nr:uncharacterized protein LOC133890092 isoform X2 [Phragmites australis]